ARPGDSETTMGVAAVCGVPDPDDRPTRAATGVGRSMLVAPLGVVGADLGPAPGVTIAEVDTGLIPTVRASLPSLANRRDDVFGPPAPVSSPFLGRGCHIHVVSATWLGHPRLIRRADRTGGRRR